MKNPMIGTTAKLKSRENEKEFIIQNGCYSPDENARIFDKWFKHAPRHLFRAVDRKYKISEKILCDVGCGYGMNLSHCKEGSYGIELESQCIDFARSLGIPVYQRNVMTDDLRDLPKVDAIWCSALLEHVDAPHILLRRLNGLLKPGGLLCVYVPTISPISFFRHVPKIGMYFNGYIHGDHINAFSAKTLRFMCERAAFRTCEVSPFYPGPLKVFDFLPLIDGIVYVGQKISGWEYPKNSMRRVAENPNGFDPKYLQTSSEVR
jgi:2-polyprenyl-3-methyl-5-hydroxy-6-metoxy-1,4-benzoquinol methylase